MMVQFPATVPGAILLSYIPACEGNLIEEPGEGREREVVRAILVQVWEKNWDTSGLLTVVLVATLNSLH